MTGLPLLLLDVDGVLCPLGSGGGEEMLESSGDYGEVRYARALPARLAALAEPFALTWATSWGHQANDVLSPLFGLPLLPVIEFGDVTFKIGETWKLPVIRRYVQERPFAWADDEIGNDAHRWARRRLAPSLLLDIRPDWGLTQENVDALLHFGATFSRSD
jgi:hypothetical protein